MLGKILTVFFLILSLPVILLLAFISLALFIPAKECSVSPTPANSPTLEQVSYSLEKTGTVVISQSQLTQALQKNFGEKVKDLRVCFDNNMINFSGEFILGNFSPSFYASTNLESSGKLELRGTKISLGGLAFNPLPDIFGGIGQQILNDQLSKMPQENSFTVKINNGELKIQTVKPVKKPSNL